MSACDLTVNLEGMGSGFLRRRKESGFLESAAGEDAVKIVDMTTKNLDYNIVC